MVDGPLPSDEIELEFLVRCKSRLRGHPMATTSIGRSQQGISSGKDVIGSLRPWAGYRVKAFPRNGLGDEYAPGTEGHLRAGRNSSSSSASLHRKTWPSGRAWAVCC